jgi:hypothetical protein
VHSLQIMGSSQGRRCATRRPITTASVVCLVVVALLVMTSSVSLAAGRSSAPPPASCGDYQCFNTAAGVLGSVPHPTPAQVATARLAKMAPASDSPRMLIGLDNGPRAYWSVSDGVAQGVSGLVRGVSAGNVLNFDHWQYVDELYYYAHNVFSVPPTQWVNAGHRNGVPVLGTVTGDCPECGAEAQTLFDAHNYVQAVHKLYAYAVAYGFDGWVIDFERGFSPSREALQAVKDLAAMKLPDGQPLRVAVYQAGNYTLRCTSPDESEECVDLLPYFQAGASWQADYNTTSGFPAEAYQSLATAGLAAQRFRAYWATYVYQDDYLTACAGAKITTSQIWNGNGDKECLRTAALFDNQRTIVRPGPPGGYYTSAALFAPEWTYFGNLPNPKPGQEAVGPADRALAHAADDALWVGVNVKYAGQNCARIGTFSNAVSSLVTPRSVVSTLPFVTSFNEGEGDVYAEGGKLVAKVPWNDLSAQDVLPTWDCAVTGDIKAAPVYGNERNGDAFNGGSALSFIGHPGEVALYQAHAPVPAGSKLTVAFETKTSSGPLPEIQLNFNDGTTRTIKSSGGGSGWNRTVGVVEGADGKTIVRVSVRFVGSGPVHSVLGELQLYDASTDTQPLPIHITATDASISWTQPTKPPIAYWNVYSNAGSCLNFLGPAFTTTYDVSARMFRAVKPTPHFVVQPVATNGQAAKIGTICTNRS